MTSLFKMATAFFQTKLNRIIPDISDFSAITKVCEFVGLIKGSFQESYFLPKSSVKQWEALRMQRAKWHKPGWLCQGGRLKTMAPLEREDNALPDCFEQFWSGPPRQLPLQQIRHANADTRWIDYHSKAKSLLWGGPQYPCTISTTAQSRTKADA